MVDKLRNSRQNVVWEVHIYRFCCSFTLNDQLTKIYILIVVREGIHYLKKGNVLGCGAILNALGQR